MAGVRLRELDPSVGTEDDKEKWNELHGEVVQSAYEVIKFERIYFVGHWLKRGSVSFVHFTEYKQCPCCIHIG